MRLTGDAMAGLRIGDLITITNASGYSIYGDQLLIVGDPCRNAALCKPGYNVVAVRVLDLYPIDIVLYDQDVVHIISRVMPPVTCAEPAALPSL